ncbi:lysylphosphatidylglycerol synthase transmembrane domain-containing protein [Roseivivax sp. THAF197b]|uniref:lysylphosphatidylglycerol synthase transmembrane domain-containing protein n=1 Tax=Roseivivax sp. THAF197b TaxID=2588299 RepID=UPI0012681698|nr:lysylphosphatidylglycerol synthase transmembrane domain-containing protein [Roseivivax sp. THAF197b]
MRLSRTQLRVVQIAVSVTLLTLLWLALDGQEALRILRRADLGWIGLAWVVMTAQTLLAAWRWKLIAGRLGQPFGYSLAAREYYMSQFVNQSLPGGMMGDAGRAYRMRKPAGLLRAAQAVFFERLSQQAGIFAIFAITYVVTTIQPGGLRWPVWLTSITAPLLIACLGLPFVLWFGWLLPGPQRRALQDLFSALEMSLIGKRVLPLQLPLALVTAGCNIFAFYACAMGTGTELPLAAVLGLVPLILFMMLVPVTVAGWGLREGVAAALFPIAGAGESAGLAASIAFGLVFLAAVLPGVLPILFRRKRVEEKDAQT